MKKITKREVCLTVPDRWGERYRGYPYKKHNEIGDRLAAMPVSELTPEKIAEVIGNDSWTVLQCAECGHDCDEVVIAAEHYFCRNCVGRMVEAMA